MMQPKRIEILFVDDITNELIASVFVSKYSIEKLKSLGIKPHLIIEIGMKELIKSCGAYYKDDEKPFSKR